MAFPRSAAHPAVAPGHPLDRRRLARIGAPGVRVGLGGHDYATVDWSLAGCRIGGYDGALSPGALVEIERLAPMDGPPRAVRIRARVLRRDTQGRELALAFHDVDRAAYALLRELMARAGADAATPAQP